MSSFVMFKKKESMTGREVSVGDYSEDYDDMSDDYPDQLYNPLPAHLYKSSPSSIKGIFFTGEKTNIYWYRPHSLYKHFKRYRYL